MILIPDRLQSLPFVKVFHQSVDCWMLHKRLDQSLQGRQSYVSKYVFSMVISGQQELWHPEGRRLTIHAGQMACIKKGLYTIHDLISNEHPFETYLFFFEDSLLDKVLSENKFRENDNSQAVPKDFFKFETPEYLFHFWKGIEKIHQLHPGNRDLMRLKSEEFLNILKLSNPGVLQQIRSLRTPQVKGLTAFMQDHYDKALTIEDYAYLTGRSVSTFRREFKAKFGTTPRQWIIQKRMEKAKSLIDKQHLDVTQVALEVGYENVSHFISAFKKIYGHTPKQLPSLDQIQLGKTKKA